MHGPYSLEGRGISCVHCAVLWGRTQAARGICCSVNFLSGRGRTKGNAVAITSITDGSVSGRRLDGNRIGTAGEQAKALSWLLLAYFDEGLRPSIWQPSSTDREISMKEDSLNEAVMHGVHVGYSGQQSYRSREMFLARQVVRRGGGGGGDSPREHRALEQTYIWWNSPCPLHSPKFFSSLWHFRQLPTPKMSSLSGNSNSECCAMCVYLHWMISDISDLAN